MMMEMCIVINQARFVLRTFFISSIGITVVICCKRELRPENP
jgi:hypothetical protein